MCHLHLTPKTAIQYNIAPFIYLHIRYEANSPLSYWLNAECVTFTKWHWLSLKILNVTSKMTHIGRYFHKGSSLWESHATLIILTETEWHCHVKIYGNMQINNSNFTLISFFWGNLKNTYSFVLLNLLSTHMQKMKLVTPMVHNIFTVKEVTSEITTSHTGQF